MYMMKWIEERLNQVSTRIWVTHLTCLSLNVQCIENTEVKTCGWSNVCYSLVHGSHFSCSSFESENKDAAVAWIIPKGHIAESITCKPCNIFYSNRFYPTQIISSSHNLFWASTWHNMLACIFHPLELQHFVYNIASYFMHFFTYSSRVSTTSETSHCF